MRGVVTKALIRNMLGFWGTLSLRNSVQSHHSELLSSKG